MSKHESDSQLLHKGPCLDQTECCSSDGCGYYDDGHAHCFSCGKTWKDAGDPVTEPTKKKAEESGLLVGEFKPLTKRGVNTETCRRYGYMIGKNKHGVSVQIAPYYDKHGTMVAQKIRTPDKDFAVIGKAKEMLLFGQNLFRDGGKRVVITEGEIDALSVAQALGSWPVVSIPNGAQGATKAFAKSLEWLESYETVVIWFDNDEPGREAAIKCAEMLSPGKCAIVHSEYKDANDMLVQAGAKAVVSAVWEAKAFRPDGLVSIDDIIEDVEKPVELGYPWCFETLTKVTYGRRKGEVIGLGAGTGVGKTDFLTQQIAFDVTVLGLNVGCLFLEQKPTETAKRIAGKIAGKRFHVPDAGWTSEELKENVAKLKGKVTFYDNFGACEWDVIANKITFMAHQGVEMFYLDHLTALADTADEKGSLEEIMKQMAMLAQRLNIIIIFVSHLTTPEGKSHEEGGRVSIRHFKGSRAIGFWSYFMFGLERNQQADDEEDRQTTTFRILKDRYTGQATGVTFPLAYDKDSGRLREGEAYVEREDEEAVPADF